MLFVNFLTVTNTSMSVRMSDPSHVSKTTCPNFMKFSDTSPVAVAQSSADDNAIHYVLPVLWMTSNFHIMVIFPQVKFHISGCDRLSDGITVSVSVHSLCM